MVSEMRTPVFLFVIAAFVFGETEVRGEDRSPWFAPCRQIVLVVADRWDSDAGKLTAWELVEGDWRIEIAEIPVTLGRNGLGLGRGLHPPGLEGPEKVEGDRRAPAGIFPLESSFGTRNRLSRRFPYRKTTPDDFWVDDPKSRHYNRWVDVSAAGVTRDWKSAEVLRRSDGLYDLALVVGHNLRPIAAGKGSAIFVHSWSAPGRPTIGCTAMDRENLEKLWKWLESRKAPVLVQGPRELIPRLPLPPGFGEAAKSALRP